MATAKGMHQMIVSDRTPVRRSVIDAVLENTEDFFSRMKDLTLKEVYAAYRQELSTLRRKVIMARLQKRAKALVAEETGVFFDKLQQKGEHDE